eukprot:TRINITY_DN273_c2_g4_i1.p1 TRINITY_DN273_c2_g4~~TRINITY_DN273_c2_g4_i1.p1  ORF type:complete len:155 (+),score=30.00 TRINITY_DN273_c2_g4_i1:92-556(+)
MGSWLEAVLWLICIIFSLALLFSSLYMLVSFADLQQRAIDAVEMCKPVNKLQYPEFLIHGLMFFLLLFSPRWYDSLLHLPLVIYNIYIYRNKMYLLDPTRVFDEFYAGKFKRLAWVKLGFFLLFFFYALIRFVLVLVKDVVGKPKNSKTIKSYI